MTGGTNIWLLYDGDCRFCRRKILFLKRWDRKNRLQCLDFRRSDLTAHRIHATPAELEARIHAVLPDGSIVTGMDAIRLAFKSIGIGWLAAPTGWPFLRPLFDALYQFIAQHRHRF